MLERFEIDKKYVFDKAICEKDVGKHDWADEIDGVEFVAEHEKGAIIGYYVVDPSWCREVVE